MLATRLGRGLRFLRNERITIYFRFVIELVLGKDVDQPSEKLRFAL
jgi:hypothetical protein